MDTAEEKISELDDKSIETSHSEMQKNPTKPPQTFKNCGTVSKNVAHIENRRRMNEPEKIFEVMMAKHFQNS